MEILNENEREDGKEARRRQGSERERECVTGGLEGESEIAREIGRGKM